MQSDRIFDHCGGIVLTGIATGALALLAYGIRYAKRLVSIDVINNPGLFKDRDISVDVRKWGDTLTVAVEGTLEGYVEPWKYIIPERCGWAEQAYVLPNTIQFVTPTHAIDLELATGKLLKEPFRYPKEYL
jgi:hypothetical protein